MKAPVKNKYGRVSISSKYPSGDGHDWSTPKGNILKGMVYRYTECKKCGALAVKVKGYSYWEYSYPVDLNIDEEEYTYEPRSCSQVTEAIQMQEALI